MIELLLQAERALAVGLVDQAERLYRQAVEADPRNAIAVVGLARVALERADDAEAWRLARRALEIDPENVAAARIATRLEEVMAHRDMSVPTAGEAAPPTRHEPVTKTVSAVGADAAHGTVGEPRPSPARRSLLDRLLRRNGR